MLCSSGTSILAFPCLTYSEDGSVIGRQVPSFIGAAKRHTSHYHLSCAFVKIVSPFCYVGFWLGWVDSIRKSIYTAAQKCGNNCSGREMAGRLDRASVVSSDLGSDPAIL